MCNYDFEILQYNEFENLTRDLLQKEFGIFIESFKDGKDGGIDLRFGIGKNEKCIVQVKRYKDWASLRSILKQEAEKVEKLNPKRYILSTSVELSPDYKDEIMEIFAPYIKSTEDILGKKDINNLLDKHPEIEKQYYKLWLSSTSILDAIIHKATINWSEFTLEEIKEEIRLYVANESFVKAFEILKKNRYVIISGIPGIGKTTLAKMLIYDILAQGYDELVCVENDMHEAASLLQEGKKQVFYFDDFLGSNTFTPGEKNFDGKLVKFIRAIKRAETDKLFIMTTREYILAQAMEYYEKLETYDIEVAKCTLGMGVYSDTIRARILYNHIAEANLSEEYIEQLLKDKSYLQIITHKCFNPRVIEAYIDNGKWRKTPAEEFVATFVQMFDKPTAVWKYAFDALPKNAQYALLVLGTMGKDVLEEDWRSAYTSLCGTVREEYAFDNSDAEWRKIIGLLEDCFVRTNMYKSGKIVVSLYNPSVLGFAVEYLRMNPDMQKHLIESAIYPEQLYKVFTNKELLVKGGDAFVLLSSELVEVVKKKLSFFITETQLTCSTDVANKDEHAPFRKIRILYDYLLHYDGRRVIEKLISKEDLTDVHTFLYLRLPFLAEIDWAEVDFTCDEIIESMWKEDLDLEDTVSFMNMLLTVGRRDFMYKEEFVKRIKDRIESYIIENYYEYSGLEATRDYITQIAERYHNDEDVFPINDHLAMIQEAEDGLYNFPEEVNINDTVLIRSEADEKQIDEIMTSLRVKEE